MARGTIKITGNKPSGIAKTIDGNSRVDGYESGVIQQEDDSDSRASGEPVVETRGESNGDFLSDYETVAGEPIRIDPGTLRGNETGNVSNISDGRKVRKPRGPNKPRKTTFASSSNLEKMLISLHIMGAALTKTPEFIIDDEEAKILSSAILEVNAAYEIPILSPKHMAMIGLVVALGTVYAPRVIAVANRKPKKQPVVINKPNSVYQSPVNGVNVTNPVAN